MLLLPSALYRQATPLPVLGVLRVCCFACFPKPVQRAGSISPQSVLPGSFLSLNQCGLITFSDICSGCTMGSISSLVPVGDFSTLLDLAHEFDMPNIAMALQACLFAPAPPVSPNSLLDHSCVDHDIHEAATTLDFTYLLNHCNPHCMRARPANQVV